MKLTWTKLAIIIIISVIQTVDQ